MNNISGTVSAVLGFLLGAVVTFGLYAAANMVWWLPAARSEGRAGLIAEQAADAIKDEQERKKEDAKLQNMSGYDLCVRAHGRVPTCDRLLLPVRPK